MALLQTEAYNINVNNMNEFIYQFRRDCRQMMIKLCQEIKKRFDMDDDLLRMISFFHPMKVFNYSSRQHLPSLGPLVRKMPRIYTGDIQMLDDEWRNLDSITLPDEFQPSDNCGVVHFYQKLGSFQECGIYYLKNLSIFSLQILALPVSNVDAERLFSKLNLIKTDIRNRLNVDSVKSLILISESVKDAEACYLYEPSEAMLNCLP